MKWQRVLDEQVRTEVREVLTMFIAIKEASDGITDRSGIKEAWIDFEGYDNNSEDDYRQAQERICAGGYGPLGDVAYITSGCSNTVRRYQMMLEAWKRSRDRQNLTKEDLVRITNVRIE
jgi:uncharacterized protein YfbU (UPF0304 family)